MKQKNAGMVALPVVLLVLALIVVAAGVVVYQSSITPSNIQNQSETASAPTSSQSIVTDPAAPDTATSSATGPNPIPANGSTSDSVVVGVSVSVGVPENPSNTPGFAY